MDQEATRFEDDLTITVPQYMKEIVAEISRLARRSPDINQRSGVSVRASVADYESLLAQRPAPRHQHRRDGSRAACFRPAVRHPAIAGKVEFETVEDGKEEQILDKLIQGAVLAVFNRYFSVSDFEDVVTRFKSGISTEVGDMMPSSNYDRVVKQVEGLSAHVEKVEPKASPAGTGFHRRVHPRRPAPEQATQQRQGGGKLQYRG